MRKNLRFLYLVAMLLAPCTSCRRHLRVDETLCRFCGASVALTGRSVRLPKGATTRIAVYLGATLAVGCGAEAETPVTTPEVVETTTVPVTPTPPLEAQPVEPEETAEPTQPEGEEDAEGDDVESERVARPRPPTPAELDVPVPAYGIAPMLPRDTDPGSLAGAYGAPPSDDGL